MRFGHLTVVSLAEPYQKNGKIRRTWNCLCDCQLDKPENEREFHKVIEWNLLSGSTKSCGCHRHDRPAVYKSPVKERLHNTYDMTSFDYGVGYVRNKDYKFLFDKEDFEILDKYCWNVIQHGYLTANEHGNPKHKRPPIRQHRYILATHGLLDFDDSNAHVDHINGNPFDNRKQNLRVVTRQENMLNQKLRVDNSTGHKGVSYNKRTGKYIASITRGHKTKHLGSYNTAEEAGAAYDKASIELFGEFTRAKDYLGNGTTAATEIIQNAKLS